jgi:Holliday junction resolvase RusA-like endonuclease
MTPLPASARALVAFDVFGTPGPQGSKKAFVNKKTGKASLAESSAKVKPWRQDVKAAAEAFVATVGTLDGALWLRMTFTLPKPASAPKRRRTYADKKPDLSKLARSTEDALTDSGLIRDDARIVEYRRLAKVFPNEGEGALRAPGVRIEIGRMPE